MTVHIIAKNDPDDLTIIIRNATHVSAGYTDGNDLCWLITKADGHVVSYPVHFWRCDIIDPDDEED